MSDTLVDTNVLLDLVTDSPHFEWSNRQLDEAILRGRPIINGVIYSELSVGYREIGELDEFLRGTGIDVIGIPKPALFLAGKAFQSYRQRGGTRTGVLPDFFIGAHAQVEALPLLTRDARRYRTDFPDVKLIVPE
jgi:predicted nucleic acid-binding protein